MKTPTACLVVAAAWAGVVWGTPANSLAAVEQVAVAAALAPEANQHATRYALVIGNNAVPKGRDALEQPLHFADDDAARYARLFAQTGATVELLTVFDADTHSRQRAFARQARAPSVAELKHAVERLSVAIRNDLREGRRPELYVAFSGHGFVDHHGTPKLALLDRNLSRDELFEDVLAKLPAAVIHLILDACHSAQLADARGLFDRERTAPAVRTGQGPALRDLAPSVRYPHVGVILATTANAKAHEWSTVRGGVFTHELMSALSGAADVNGDGKVEYSEVAAFVSSANRDVPDARARPTVTAIPPAVDRNVALIDLRYASQQKAFLVGNFAPLGHITIEDQQGQRTLDSHLGDPRRRVIAVPANRWLFLYARGGAGGSGSPREAKFRARPGQTIEIEQLAFVEQRALTTPRGAIEDALAQALFTSPYTASYYRGFVDSTAATPVDNEAALLFTATLGPIAVVDAKRDRRSQPALDRDWAKPLAWTATSLAAVGLGTTAYFTYATLQAKGDLDRTSLQSEAHRAHDRYQKNLRFGIGAGAASAVLSGAAVYLWSRAWAGTSSSSSSKSSADQAASGDLGRVAIAPAPAGSGLEMVYTVRW